MKAYTEDKLVTKTVEHIEDPLFSGTCKSIKNWDQGKQTFFDVDAMLYDHKISKMMDQTKRGI